MIEITTGATDEPTIGEMNDLTVDEIRRKYPRWWDMRDGDGAPTNGEVLTLEPDELARKYPEWCSEHCYDAEYRPHRFVTHAEEQAWLDAVLRAEEEPDILSGLGTAMTQAVERARRERSARWGESIGRYRRKLWKENPDFTQENVAAFLDMGGKKRLSQIEHAERGKAPLTVLELFALSDLLGVPPMQLIGETTDAEERLLGHWRAMSDGQRDALMRLLDSFLPQDEEPDEEPGGNPQ
ncbi:MAG: hypothetical protein SOI24_08220 [Coriobacteriales bacterium]|jgi:hypothetical protein